MRASLHERASRYLHCLSPSFHAHSQNCRYASTRPHLSTTFLQIPNTIYPAKVDDKSPTTRKSRHKGCNPRRTILANRGWDKDEVRDNLVPMLLCCRARFSSHQDNGLQYSPQLPSENEAPSEHYWCPKSICGGGFYRYSAHQLY